MFTTFQILACSLIAATGVAGHGYVQNFSANGQIYQGFHPFTDPYADPVPARAVRHVPSDGPVTNVQDASIGCNVGGQKPAGIVATIAAGSPITFTWTNWPADHHGPVSTYMASCGGSCSSFDSTNAKWFKVDAAGYDSAKNTWASDDLIANGNTWTSTIPSQLKAGEYLVRNEIIALHSLPAQFYPSCAQVKVTGNGNTVPSGDALVSIPGLYDSVQFPDIWDTPFTFKIPGPAPAFASSGNSNSQAPAAESTSTSGSSHAPTSTSAITSSVPTASEDPSETTASPVSSSSLAAPSATSAGGNGTCRRNRKRSYVHIFTGRRDRD
ncbi:Endo-beta-1,4-glucanase D [Abortiporus biennis]